MIRFDSSQHFVPSTLVAILLLAGCSDTSGNIARARSAYLEGRYEDAMALFDAARRAQTDDVNAVYGYARAAAEFHLYDEAIPAYAQAVLLAPDDAQVWEGFAQALTWGGVLKGRADWLEQAMQRGHEALLHAPDRPGIHDNLKMAAGQMKAHGRYLAIMEDLHRRFPDSAVTEIVWWEARLQGARTGLVEEAEDDLQVHLRSELAKWTGEAMDRRGSAQTYRLWRGYQLTDQGEEADALARGLWEGGSLDPIEKAICFRQVVLNEWMEAQIAGEPEGILAILAAAKSRFPATWTDGTQQWGNLLAWEYEALVAVLSDSDPDAPVDGKRLDALLAVAEACSRYDTYGRLGYYYGTALLLVDRGWRPERALDLASEGLRALEEDRAGLFYPGSTVYELEQARKRNEADLLQVKGSALASLGREEEARDALIAATERDPSEDHYAALGSFQADRGDHRASYEAYLWATASARREGSQLAPQHESRLRDAATDAGIAASDVEKDLAAKEAEARRAYVTRLVGDRMDAAPPAFALEDAAGKAWRLEDLKGKVVVLNYWATWCGPCVQEMPHYARLVSEYERGGQVKMLAVNTDDDRSLVAPFLEEKGYDFTVVYDRGTQVALNITGIPTTIILGPEGRIQFRQVGFSGEERYLEEMRQRIDALLKP